MDIISVIAALLTIATLSGLLAAWTLLGLLVYVDRWDEANPHTREPTPEAGRGKQW
jgi:hypothetical protein